MGGRLILAQVTAEGVKKSTKIGTWFLNKLNTLDLLNEEYFNQVSKKHNLFKETTNNKQEHNDYESDNAMFAPYHYGILLIDFKDKKVFSCNNYNGFLMFGTNKVIMDYENFGRNKQTEIKVQDFEGNLKEVYSIFEETPFEFTTPRMIESCIRNKGNLYVNNSRFIIRQDDDYFSIAARIYGQDLSKLSKEQAKQYIEDKYSRDDDYNGQDLKGWTNIEITKPGWEIINGDKSYRYLKSAYDYYTQTNMLNEEEKMLWLKQLEEVKKEENPED